jgi:hypothetical protein
MSIKIATLMERLRIQSILQRLIRSQGRDLALDTVLEAIRLEFPDQITKHNETQTKRTTESHRHTTK